MKLNISPKGRYGYWITGANPVMGPYASKSEAEVDRVSLSRTFRSDPEFFELGERPMRIARSKAIAVFEALGMPAAADWNKKRMQSKVNDLPRSVDLDFELEDEDLNKVLHDMLVAVDSDEGVEVYNDEDAPAAETKDDAPKDEAEPKKESKEKPAKVIKDEPKAKDEKEDEPAKDDSKPKPKKSREPREGSLVAVAISILKEHGEPMKPKDIVAAAIEQGWKTNGKTPEATLAARIYTDLKSDTPRFKKAGKGMFELA